MDTCLFRAQNPASPLVVLDTFEGEASDVLEAVRSLTDADFSLLEVSGMSWNRDLSPWEAPAVFRNYAPFGGKADEFCIKLTEEAIPSALYQLGAMPSFIAIAGYSLAGLFAVYALYKSSVFSRAASASGSLWFPGFLEYASTHEFAGKPERIYLSLGDKEAKTRNPVMSTVQDNTEKLAMLFRERNVDVSFELNPGNHFQDPALRMAKGIADVLL